MAVKTPSAWAKPEHTPAHEPATEPLKVVYSEDVAPEDALASWPSSPKGLVKLAIEKGWSVKCRQARAGDDRVAISSWRVKCKKEGHGGLLAVWAQYAGDAPDSKQKCHVTTTYKLGAHGLERAKVTELKNIIKESK